MDNCIKVGKLTGTGAAINVELGFLPDYVLVLNATDGNMRAEWFEGMTQGTAVRDNAATLATLGANGISSYLGSSTVAPGFTLGSALSIAAKDIYYVAMRTTSGK